MHEKGEERRPSIPVAGVSRSSRLQQTVRAAVAAYEIEDMKSRTAVASAGWISVKVRQKPRGFEADQRRPLPRTLIMTRLSGSEATPSRPGRIVKELTEAAGKGASVKNQSISRILSPDL
jgi:hypothetical protein